MYRINGFSLIEVIASTFILMTVIITILPIVATIDKSQAVLKDKRVLTRQLHDYLQDYIWEPDVTLPDTKKEEYNNQLVIYQFTMEGEFLKGCVSFENIRTQKNESICLYGVH